MFDWARFRRLAAVHWAEHGRGYLWFLGIGVLVHACAWLLVTEGARHAERYAVDAQFGMYLGGYLVTSLLFAARPLAGLAQRGSALTYFMRPASAFEKILLIFLVVAVAYPLAYTLAFQICNVPGAWIAKSVDAGLVATAADSSIAPIRRTYGPYIPFLVSGDLSVEVSVFLVGISLQALVIAGALFFRRLAGLKTFVILFVLVFVAIPLLNVVSGAELGKLLGGGGTESLGMILRVWKYTVCLGVPALFWVATYFLLRERQSQ